LTTVAGPREVPLPERGADVGADPGPGFDLYSPFTDDMSVALLRVFAGITRPAALWFDFINSIDIIRFLFRMVVVRQSP
jgi:hypothetical protein